MEIKAPDPDNVSLMVIWWRIIGVFLGNMIVFVVMWWTVKDRADLIRRLVVSPIIGLVAGGPVMENVLHWPATTGNSVFVFMGVTFLAWPAMWSAVWAVETYKGKRKRK